MRSLTKMSVYKTILKGSQAIIFLEHNLHVHSKYVISFKHKAAQSFIVDK